MTLDEKIEWTDRLREARDMGEVLDDFADAIRSEGMKLFKLELKRGRKGLDVVVHAESEEAAKAHILGKYPGWKVSGELHEISGAVHFVVAELEAE